MILSNQCVEMSLSVAYYLHWLSSFVFNILFILNTMNQLEAFIQQDQLEQLSMLLQQSLQGIKTQENYAFFKQLESKP